jgi:hypothetical protein
MRVAHNNIASAVLQQGLRQIGCSIGSQNQAALLVKWLSGPPPGRAFGMSKGHNGRSLPMQLPRPFDRVSDEQEVVQAARIERHFMSNGCQAHPRGGLLG